MPDRRSNPPPRHENRQPPRAGASGSNDRPDLRLWREEAEGTENSGAGTYKFPVAGSTGGPSAGGRGRRLVAARVAESPLEHSFEGSPCAVLNGGDDPDCLGRIVSSRQLVKEIESTLDRMQSRLSRFRNEMDEAFRFPSPPDGGLPPAA